MTSPGSGERPESGLVSRYMRLSDAVQAQTNGLLDRIDANPDDRDARDALVGLGRELAEQGCGLLDYVGLDVSPVFSALDDMIDSASRRDDN
ncbi:hypothetical protein BAY59_27725 [Prauserella coralliicola]|nr:hypothetical protein BAY59_27725 [Prauserella coralliicola]